MAEQALINLEHRELIAAMIKYLDIHEGLWTISPQFGVQGGSMGVSPETASPGLLIMINKIGIQRVEGEPKPGQITVDAATVNPA